MFVPQAHNVKFLFTLSGGHISPILVAAEREGIRVVDTRHEVSNVQSWARVFNGALTKAEAQKFGASSPTIFV